MQKERIEPEDDERIDREAEEEVERAGLQQGGTRGSSNQGGPESSPEPEKNEALRLNRRRDRGSRATEGHHGVEPNEQTKSQPRGPLPEGATAEDYLGGEKPHKTRGTGATRGKSGVKNEVV
jgi:hypothetical protein